MDNSTPRFLVNDDGSTFADEVSTLRVQFDRLNDTARSEFRDANANALARHSAERLLIVAGPGAGKSLIFRTRIKFWLERDRESAIYVSSFVRKLVRDLEKEIATDDQLSDEDRARVTVSTLHRLARSLVEVAHGTSALPLQHHVQVIAGEWPGVVWSDVLRFHPDLRARDYLYEAFEHQLHTEEFDESESWGRVRATYWDLVRFYNAVGFADMIWLAREAVDERPQLSTHLRWIIDEYQDFNAAENHLIRSLTGSVRGVLIAGDDDQALYQELKASLPSILISYYDGSEFANGMLPYCSRCSYYVCLAASAFIASHRADGAIEKIFLPVHVDEQAPKVQIVATFQPTSAVDYIAKFVQDHRSELDEHRAAMEAGDEVDPFLLVLTPEKSAKFYRGRYHADAKLRDLLAEFSVVSTGRSADYWRVAAYCQATWYPHDNFAVRKVLHYEYVPTDHVHDLIVRAMAEDRPLGDLLDDTPLAGAMTRARSVGDVLRDETLDAQGHSAAVATLLTGLDVGKLTSDLEAAPIDLFTDFAENQAEELIETAGEVAPVEMMTMFRAKGLSAKHVIIIGCDDRNLARTQPLTFYVALSRARRSLHLIVSMQAGGSQAAHPYLLSLPSSCCEYIEYKKTGRVATRLRSRQAFTDLLTRWGQAARRR